MFFFYVIGYRRVSLMTYRQVLCWNGDYFILIIAV